MGLNEIILLIRVDKTTIGVTVEKLVPGSTLQVLLTA